MNSTGRTWHVSGSSRQMNSTGRTWHVWDSSRQMDSTGRTWHVSDSRRQMNSEGRAWHISGSRQMDNKGRAWHALSSRRQMDSTGRAWHVSGSQQYGWREYMYIYYKGHWKRLALKIETTAWYVSYPAFIVHLPAAACLSCWIMFGIFLLVVPQMLLLGLNS